MVVIVKNSGKRDKKYKTTFIKQKLSLRMKQSIQSYGEIMKYVAEAKRDKTLNSVARHYCYHMSEIQPH